MPGRSRRADGVWHAAGGWIKPAALVRAWLSDPGVQFRGGVRVRRLHRLQRWELLDAQDEVVAEADLVVVAAALGSGELLPGLAVGPVRGQVSWRAGDAIPAVEAPVNGNGHFLPAVPLPGGMAWLTGSTYGRGDTSLLPRHDDQLANLERLRTLQPAVAAALAPAFMAGEVQAWCGVRCASSDRRPLVGEIAPGLWVSTAMGSRGLTFAWLAAELLAARLHGEPLPLALRLASALDVGRQGTASTA